MWWRLYIAVFSCVAWGVACGGQTETRTNEAAGTGGVGGSASTGGAAGSNVASACARGFLPLDEKDPRCSGEPCGALPTPNDGRLRFSKRCCTDAATCGSGSESIFGAACFERDQPGGTSGDCGETSVFLYVDPGSDVAIVPTFPGCCRSDGLCGFDTSGTLGAGCVERSLFGDALRTGCIPANLEADFETVLCTP